MQDSKPTHERAGLGFTKSGWPRTADRPAASRPGKLPTIACAALLAAACDWFEYEGPADPGTPAVPQELTGVWAGTFYPESTTQRLLPGASSMRLTLEAEDRSLTGELEFAFPWLAWPQDPFYLGASVEPYESTSQYVHWHTQSEKREGVYAYVVDFDWSYDFANDTISGEGGYGLWVWAPPGQGPSGWAVTVTGRLVLARGVEGLRLIAEDEEEGLFAPVEWDRLPDSDG